jgi:uncharacterized membrane protein
LIPFYVMVVGIGLARLIGELGWSALDSWRAAARAGLALMFAFTASAHFAPRTRPDLIRMVPPQFPRPEVLVTLTGIAEFAGAVGLLVPGMARWAALGLIILLVAMFPANVYAARIGHEIAGRAVPPLIIRAPLQLLWIGVLSWSTF